MAANQHIKSLLVEFRIDNILVEQEVLYALKRPVVDNLVNSKEESLKRVKSITGKDFAFYKVDLLDKDALKTVFEEHEIDAVIHFAGLKAVGESAEIPLAYYHNNLTGTFNLCDLMREHGVKWKVMHGPEPMQCFNGDLGVHVESIDGTHSRNVHFDDIWKSEVGEWMFLHKEHCSWDEWMDEAEMFL